MREFTSTSSTTSLQKRMPQAFPSAQQPPANKLGCIKPNKYSSNNDAEQITSSSNLKKLQQINLTYYWYAYGKFLADNIPLIDETNKTQRSESGLLILADGQDCKWRNKNNDDFIPFSGRAMKTNPPNRKADQYESESITRKRSTKKENALLYSYRDLVSLLILASLLCLKNASPCSCFDYSEYHQHSGLIESDHVSTMDYWRETSRLFWC